jgi:nickel-dependent lactate racemase
MQSIERAADIVLVSAGGSPKDINLYQAQKALDNALYAVRQDGIIVLLAQCPEGLGNATFQAWLDQAQTGDDLLRRIEREFVLGGHKAAAIGSALAKARLFLVSELPASSIDLEGVQCFASAETALAAAFAALGPEASVAVLPQGGSILPQVPS